MKVKWVKRNVIQAQLNPDRDLSRADLTSLRRISEEMAATKAAIQKIPTELSELSEITAALKTIASKISDNTSALKEIRSKLK